MRSSRDDRLPSPPLAQTLVRLRLANPYLRVHLGDPGDVGGVALSSLLNEPVPLLDTHLAAMARHYQAGEREVLARFYLSGFSFHLAHFAVGAFVRERRVPLLEPASLGLTCNAIGFPTAVVLSRERYFCLPDDDRHAAAKTVEDMVALRHQLRAQLVFAYQPLIAALRQRARLGERALWIAAAETCATALVDALPAGTSPAAAGEMVRALLGDSASPLRASPEIVSVTDDARAPLGLLGHDCCAMFRLPNQPYCTTCPHLPHDQRMAALTAWLKAKSDR